MKKKKILNLYAGIGGNRKKWGPGNEITAVEMEPEIARIYRDNFPDDKIIIGDAHQYLLDHYKEFDFIWSSPPCQSHSKMMKGTRHETVKYFDLNLYQEIILLQNFFKGKWLVENVRPYYKPLINPTAKIGRHLFWSNYGILNCEIPKPPGDLINSSTIEDGEKLKDWLGIHYDKVIYYKNNHDPCQILRNCVHPDLGLHIFNESKRTGLFCL